MSVVSFFCVKCDLDQDRDAELVRTSVAKFFRARCSRCDAKLIRKADDPAHDPYFWESKKLRAQRDKLRIDLIQPGASNFRMYYKTQYDKMQRDLEQAEQKEIAQRKERDAFYKKWWYNISTRGVVKHAIEAEEKIRSSTGSR